MSSSSSNGNPKALPRQGSGSSEVVEGSARCAYPLCSLIDFLPFECDCCGKVFCLEHRTYRSHECKVANKKDTLAIVCPLCQSTLVMKGNQDANQIWEIHFSNQCQGRDQPMAKKVKTKCAFRSCKDTLGPSNKYACQLCRQDFCLKHRFKDSHQCSRRQNGRKNDNRGNVANSMADAWSRFASTSSTASTNKNNKNNTSNKTTATTSNKKASNGFSAFSSPTNNNNNNKGKAIADEIIDLTNSPPPHSSTFSSNISANTTNIASSTTAIYSSPNRPSTQTASNPSLKCPFGCINTFDTEEALMKHISRLHPDNPSGGGKGGSKAKKHRKNNQGKNMNRNRPNSDPNQEGCCVF